MSEKQNAEMLELADKLALLDLDDDGENKRAIIALLSPFFAAPAPHSKADEIANLIREHVDYFLQDEQGPINAAKAIIALFATPLSAGADTIEIGVAYEKHAKRIFGTGPKSIDSITHFYAGFKAGRLAPQPQETRHDEDRS